MNWLDLFFWMTASLGVPLVVLIASFVAVVVVAILAIVIIVFVTFAVASTAVAKGAGERSGRFDRWSGGDVFFVVWRGDVGEAGIIGVQRVTEECEMELQRLSVIFYS